MHYGIHKWKVLAVTALFCCSCSAAFAGVGTEIGVSIPMGGSSTTTTGESTESYASFSAHGLFVEATTDEKGGGLHMELKLTNLTDTPIAFEHRSGQSYDFTITDEKNAELYRWSNGMAFTQAFTSSSVDAHASVTYTADLARKDFKKIRDKAALVHMYITDTDYAVALSLPSSKTVTRSQPVMIYGGIGIGSGHGW